MIDLGYKNHQLRPDAVPSEFLIYGSVVRTMITDNNKKNIQMQSPNVSTQVTCINLRNKGLHSFYCYHDQKFIDRLLS